MLELSLAEIDVDECFWLSCYLVDDGDFKTPEAGVVFGDVTVNYAKKGAAALTGKTLVETDWEEIGAGWYKIKFTKAELDTPGDFGYIVSAAGRLAYPGMIKIVEYTAAELKAKIDLLATESNATANKGEIIAGIDLTATEENAASNKAEIIAEIDINEAKINALNVRRIILAPKIGTMDLRVFRYNDVELTFEESMDLTGAVAYFSVKRTDKETSYVIEKSTDNSEEGEIDIVNGIIKFILVPDDTASIKSGKYVYDMTVIKDGKIKTKVKGTIEFLTPVRR